MFCDCSHKAQDELHGKGRRVANILGSGKKKDKGSSNREVRCTVCGKTHEVK